MDALNNYRDNHSSDDDSEDSDKECTVWKRATAVKRIYEDENLPIAQNAELTETSSNPKRKRNTVWTEVLEDQLISEDLEDCLLKNKPAHYDCRGKESYDYTLKYKDPRNVDDADCSMDEVYNKKKRNSVPPQYKHKVKKYVKLNGNEKNAAYKICKVLNEKKAYLIKRIVKTVGVEKSNALLKMTEEIEENGGMMIKNNARRRTPGGVYFQLLKADKDVTQEMLDTIFEGEMSCVELKKYYAEKKKKRKQFLEDKKGKKSEEITILEETETMNMDAEESSYIINPQNSNGENNSIPPPVPTKNSSDLEEGEIED